MYHEDWYGFLVLLRFFILGSFFLINCVGSFWKHVLLDLPRVKHQFWLLHYGFVAFLTINWRQASFKFHPADFFSSVSQNLANLNYCKVGYAFGICIEIMRSHFSRVWLSDFHLLCASSKYLLICVWLDVCKNTLMPVHCVLFKSFTGVIIQCKAISNNQHNKSRASLQGFIAYARTERYERKGNTW